MERRRFLQLAAATALPPAWAGGAKVEVLAHRGASAWFPEHTLAGYARAIADGADFIGPDLVCTSDGVLVARHEIDLSASTDVASHREFASRRCTKTIDGVTANGWFVDDFTFAELRTLRAVEAMPQVRPGNQRYDGQFCIPSWADIIALAKAQARPIGLVPELKHCAYYASRALALEQRFADSLLTLGPALTVQCFEAPALRTLRTLLGKRPGLRLMQLVDDATPADDAMVTPAGLRVVATYADSIAPSKRRIIPTLPDGRLGAATSLVEQAHQLGLQVCTWTFRPENKFLPSEYQDGQGHHARNEAGSVAEMRRFIEAGIDAFFTDDPAIGRRAVG